MYWLCLPLALAALCLAIVAAHAWLVAAGLLAMLALLTAWARGWYRSRLGAAADAPEPDIHAIIDPADITEGAVVRARTIGRVPRPLAENYEGAAIAVEQGRTWLWLVADDNFNVWQRSLLLQFELVDLPPKKSAGQQKGGPG